MNTPRLCAMLATLVALTALTGCPPAKARPEGAPGASAATGPAEPAPLPPQATLALDALPTIERPVNQPAGTTDPRAEERLATAKKSFDRNQFPAAVTELEKAIGYDPKSVPIRRLLALSYAALGDLAKARQHLEIVAAAAGDDAQVQELLGQAAAAAGQRDQAILRFRTALACSDAKEDSPVTAESMLWLAEELRLQGYLTASLQAHEKLADLIARHGEKYLSSPLLRQRVSEPEKLLLQRGQLLMGLRRYDEAAELLDTAYRQNKTDLNAGWLLLKAQVAARQFAKAEPLLVDLLKQPGTEAVAAAMALELYRAMNDPEGPQRLLAAYKEKYGNPSPETTLSLAEAWHKLGSPAQAEEMLATLVQGLPAFAPGALRLAGWRLETGRPAEALAVLSRLLESGDAAAGKARELIESAGGKAFPGDFDQTFAAQARADTSTHKDIQSYLAGVVARATGKKHLACEQFEAAIGANPQSVPAYEALAETYVDLGEDDKAAALVDQAEKNAPGSYVSYYLRGKTQLNQGETAKAIGNLLQALKSKKDHVPSAILLARAYEDNGDPKQARDTLKAAIVLSDDEQLYAALFQLCLRGGDLAQARAVVEDLRQKHPTSREALALLAEAQLRGGDVPSARETLAQLVAAAPDYEKGRVLQILLEVGLTPQSMISKARFDRAVAALQDVLQRNPQSDVALDSLADVFAMRHRYADSAAIRAKLYAAKPRDLARLVNLVDALQKAEQKSEAAGVLERALDAYPGNTNVRMLYAAVLTDAGQYDKAIAFLRKWISDSPPKAGEPDPREVRLAFALAKGGQADEAHKILDRLLRDRTDLLDQAPLRMAKLEVFAAAKQYDQLESYAENWLGGDDSRSAVLAVMGLLLQDKQFDRAEKWALRWSDQWAKERTGREIAWAVRASIVGSLVREKQPDRARALYEKISAQAGQPEGTQGVAFLLMAGLVYPDPKDSAKVIAALEQGLKIDPDSADVGNNLGYMLADLGIRLDEAETLLRKALAAKPEPNIKDSLGWVKYKQGDFHAAMDFLLQGLNDPRGQGEHSVIYDHTGDTYWRLGQKDQALEMWAQAADLAGAEVEAEGEQTDSDTRRAAEMAPKKIQAVQAGKAPPVAPLGEGVKEP